MDVFLILVFTFIPSIVMSVFSIIHKSNIRISRNMSDERFIVYLPKMVLWVGAMCVFMSGLIIALFTFFSEEKPHIVFYVVFSIFILLGTYLILKTLKFKVVVKGNSITYYSIFAKPYMFAFDDIVSVKRQVKRNNLKTERMIIQTMDGKKIIVENAEISYERLLKRIKADVKKEFLIGFE